MRTIVAVLVGVVVGVGGTIGVQAVTDDSGAGGTPNPSFRSEVRKGLAEEWGDIYAQCIESARKWNPFREGAGPEPTKAECKRRADAVLP